VRKLALVLVLLLIVAGLAVTAAEILRPYRGYAGSAIVDIPPGAPATEAASRLAAKGVLAHRWPFLLLYAAGRWRYHLRAGAYLFDRPMRPLDVFRKIARGDVYIRAVTIPEGSNRFDMARILQNRLDIPAEDFLQVTQDPAAIRDLDPQATSLEGYLFPDTYRFEYHASASHVAAVMLARFREIFRRDFQGDLNRSDLDLHQAITLASIVEKESSDPLDRPIVAQVFERRLRIGMLLESDPTVRYAVELDGRPPGAIAKSDFQIASPYNTYVRAGLPAGPIANPGAAAIRAVFHPASTRFLYFVSDNHGGHLFARTLAEHQRNVARYRRQAAVERRPTPDATEPPRKARRVRHPQRGHRARKLRR
jgi:peptidoglycan lytic transglycosylase G